VVKLLLNQPGIELDTICIDNDTPLMLAAKKGAPEIVALLLAAGADPNVKNKNGETAISLTANHPQIQNQITQFLEAKKSLPK
jgi:ankyrin repeat protein